MTRRSSAPVTRLLSMKQLMGIGIFFALGGTGPVKSFAEERPKVPPLSPPKKSSESPGSDADPGTPATPTDAYRAIPSAATIGLAFATEKIDGITVYKIISAGRDSPYKPFEKTETYFKEIPSEDPDEKPVPYISKSTSENKAHVLEK
jgi:hypothetical protein